MRTLSASALNSFLTWVKDSASRSVKAPGATESDAAYQTAPTPKSARAMIPMASLRVFFISGKAVGQEACD